MPKGFKHMDLNIRSQIFALKSIGMSERAIARKLNFHHSAINNEIKYNRDVDGYDPIRADVIARKRRFDATKQVFRITGKLKDEVVKLLENGLSPEQISGRLKIEEVMKISHETIYKFIWADKKTGGKLYQLLRHNGKKYNKRDGKTAGRGCIKNRVDIDQRPAIVEEKSRFGDIELDTVIGKQGSHPVLVTAVDRYSKFTKISLAKDKSMEEVGCKTAISLAKLPFDIKTITYDNGKEFANHEDVGLILRAKTYFAKPYHSWERGLNEHTNGLIRQYFPKRMDFSKLTKDMVQRVEDLLNFRPRKSLNYLTPFEVVYNTKINLSSVAFQA